MLRAVQQRPDIWAFGAVVYEVLTGKRAFAGDDVSDTLAAVLRAEPDFDALPVDTPEVLRNVLRLCMTKDVKERVHDIADVRLALKGAFGATTHKEDMVVSRFSMRAPVAAVLGALIAGLLAWSTLARDPAPAPVVQFSVTPPDTQPLLVANQNRDLVVTPDGTRLVYFAGGFANKQLYARPISDLEGVPIRQAINSFGLFTSPDGTWNGFMDESSNELKKVSILGGAPEVICDVASGQIRGATWGTDGTIIFGALGEGGLWRVSADGSEPEVVAVPDPGRGETGYFWPAFLPSGRALVYTIYLGSPSRHTANPGVSLRSEDVQLAVLNLDTNEHTILVPGSNPYYSRTGHLVYGLENALWAVRFDVDRLTTIGEPVSVLEGVTTKSGGGVDFSLSANGVLAYVPFERGFDDKSTLVWVDREGQEEPLPAEPRPYVGVRVSPDGRSVALDVADPTNRDVWIYDLVGNRTTRLTFGPDVDADPVWAPDGSGIFLSSGRNDERNMFWKRIDGTDAVRLTESRNNQRPTDVSRDGMVLIFDDGFSRDVATLSLAGDSEAEVLIATDSSEFNADLSPDDRWLAYESNETGQMQIHVRPFPNVNAGRWLVSQGQGGNAIWSRDGRELFYTAQDALYAVSVETNPTFSPGRAVRLFEVDGYFWGNRRSYDVSPDGQRFLMIKQREGEEVATVSPKLVVVLNWHEELKRLVPSQ